MPRLTANLLERLSAQPRMTDATRRLLRHILTAPYRVVAA